MSSNLQAAAAASMTPSQPIQTSACARSLNVTRISRGGGASARKPPPATSLDADKTRLPYDPAPRREPAKVKEPPPPPPAAIIRMAKERREAMPLAERLDPGDVDFGKVSCALVLALWRGLRT